MRKILLFVLLALIGISASARKSYITVSAHPYRGNAIVQMSLSGDVPINIPNVEPDDGYWITGSYSIGQMLNILSGYGYEVELMAPISENTHSYVQYLLSKEVPSGQTVSEGDVNKDGEVTIADINRIVNIILGIVRDNPSLLKQYGK